MLTLLILATLMVLFGILFRKSLTKVIGYNLYGNVTRLPIYIGWCCIILLASFLTLCIVSNNYVNYDSKEYGIIQLNGKYITSTINKNGRISYAIAYQENNTLSILYVDKFIMADSLKLVISKPKSKLGIWGFDFVNYDKIYNDVHVTPNLINNIGVEQQ
jgi:hypothetical protein